jgi:hypothetical protein
MGEERKLYKVSAGNPEGKKTEAIEGWDQNESWRDWLGGGGV